jgi:hypothetical protein
MMKRLLVCCAHHDLLLEIAQRAFAWTLRAVRFFAAFCLGLS